MLVTHEKTPVLALIRPTQQQRGPWPKVCALNMIILLLPTELEPPRSWTVNTKHVWYLSSGSSSIANETERTRNVSSQMWNSVMALLRSEFLACSCSFFNFLAQNTKRKPLFILNICFYAESRDCLWDVKSWIITTNGRFVASCCAEVI